MDELISKQMKAIFQLEYKRVNIINLTKSSTNSSYFLQTTFIN